jgi:hypothetical protein
MKTTLGLITIITSLFFSACANNNRAEYWNPRRAANAYNPTQQVAQPNYYVKTIASGIPQRYDRVFGGLLRPPLTRWRLSGARRSKLKLHVRLQLSSNERSRSRNTAAINNFAKTQFGERAPSLAGQRQLFLVFYFQLINPRSRGATNGLI